MDKLITVRKAAEILGCSEKTVRRLVCDGELVACKLRGSLRLDFKHLTKYIDQKIYEFMEKNGVPEIFGSD